MASTHIEATAIVPFTRDEVFGYLADLENHWSLAGRFIEVVDLDREVTEQGVASVTGGRVRMRGPLGISRTARTRVLAADAPNGMFGTAHLGSRTLAVVSWTLVDDAAGALVGLRAEIVRAGALDRFLLALGGRRWLERCFASTLERLGDVIEPRAEARPGPQPPNTHREHPATARGRGLAASRVPRMRLTETRAQRS